MYEQRDDYFQVNFAHFEFEHLNFKAAGAEVNIGSSLKP